MCAMKRRRAAQYRALCGRLPAAVAAVRVPTCHVGALIGRIGACPSAVGATRRPLAGVSVITVLAGGGRQSPAKPGAPPPHGC